MRHTDHRCKKCGGWLNEDRGCDACDSHGSSPSAGSDAGSKIKHVFVLELTRKQAKQIRAEWASHAEDGGTIIMQPGLNFGPFVVKNVSARCAILTKDGATSVNTALAPKKHQNKDSAT